MKNPELIAMLAGGAMGGLFAPMLLAIILGLSGYAPGNELYGALMTAASPMGVYLGAVSAHLWFLWNEGE